MKLRKLSIGATALALILATSCGDHKTEQQASAPATAEALSPQPGYIPFDILNEYPHDPAAFTEGLEYHDGFLYESTGEYGTSELRKVDVKTGKVVQRVKMESQYFGEGLTILGGKIYQLTYREGKGFVYDLNTLKLLKTFAFNAPEGWGMTNDGKSLIFDDGTNVLHYLDPETLKETHTLAVTDEHGAVNQINEMEMIHGFLYANIWQIDVIVKIDPATGKVVGKADLSNLRQRIGLPPMSERRGDPEVLNGIAYDSAGNHLYITGKYWPKLLEVKLDN